MQKHYRQGDILIIQIPPPIARLNPVPHAIILEGEHNHRLENGTVYRIHWRFSGKYSYWRILYAASGCRVVHEEHHPIALPEGYYGVVRQREYQSFNPRDSRGGWYWVTD